ncbi:MAG: hypothetical protein V4772_08535 [Pseudomonadota bacterium]
MLTLPIVIGKSYVRRDGVVVVAALPHQDYDPTKFVWSKPGQAEDEDDGHVWASTGRVRSIGMSTDFPTDLIADHPEQKPAGHPHAASMLLYASDAAECLEPWKMWQIQAIPEYEWVNCTSHPEWNICIQYRRKPRTVKIGDCEIQAPERVAPAVGSPYWSICIDAEFPVDSQTWDGCKVDKRLLERGLVHLNEKSAEAHAKALIALTAKK